MIMVFVWLVIACTGWNLCCANGIKYPWLTQKPNMRQEADKLLSGFNGLYNEIDAQNGLNEVIDDGLNELPKINYPFAMMKYWALLNQKMHQKNAIQSPVIKRIPFQNANSFSPDTDSDDTDTLFVELGEPAYQPDPPVLDRNVLETFRKLKSTQDSKDRN